MNLVARFPCGSIVNKETGIVTGCEALSRASEMDLHGILPQWGPQAGGTTVQIFGTDIEDSAFTWCRFALPTHIGREEQLIPNVSAKILLQNWQIVR